jgi:protein-tyrosine-phosphatase
LLCADGSDVADPVGGPRQRYRQCAEQIGHQLDDWIDEVTS